jgi:hypothetical protein
MFIANAVPCRVIEPEKAVFIQMDEEIGDRFRRA